MGKRINDDNARRALRSRPCDEELAHARSTYQDDIKVDI